MGRPPRVERRYDRAEVRLSAPPPSPTWRSSPTSARARSRIRTTSETAAAQRPETSRSCARARASATRSTIARTATTQIFQIWILPKQRGGRPTWGNRPFPEARARGPLRAARVGVRGDGDALPIRTAARVVGATLTAGESAEYALGAGRHAYLVPATGAVELNGVRLDARDGAAIRDEAVLRVKALEDAEVLLVDAA